MGCVDPSADPEANQLVASESALSDTAREHSDSPAAQSASTMDIIKLKARYSFAVDLVTKSPSQINQLTDLMTDDIVVDYGPSGVYSGKAAVANFFQNILPQAVAWGFHMPQNPVIEVTNNTTATGEWYVHAYGVYNGAFAAGPVPVFGRYHDTYVKTAKGWLFKTITLTIDTPPSEH
jgi:hypothetical protein